MSALPNIQQAPQISLTEFLAAFYPMTQEKINLRSFKAKGAPDGFATFPKTYTTTISQLSVDASFRKKLDSANLTRGIYFTVNSGGNADSDIKRYNAFFVESDTKAIAEQNEALDKSPILPSIRVKTKKSVHAYWLIDGECTEEDWREIQQRLISYFDGDKTIKNPSRVMRLPFFNHVTFNANEDYTYVPVELGEFNPTRRNTVAEMKEAFPVVLQESKALTIVPQLGIAEAQLHCFDERNAELKRRIMSAGKQNKRGVFETKGICHNGESERAIMFNPATGAVKCLKGCSHQEVMAAFGLAETAPYNPSTGRRLLTDGSANRGQNHANNNELLTKLASAPTTDAGNAECMAALYGDVIRYCHTRKKWLIWDGVRWRIDACERTTSLAISMARARQQAAWRDAQTHHQLFQWGRNSESVTRLEAALKLSRGISQFSTTIADYDADPLLAATTNGTLDLSDGSFRESVLADYLTLQLGAPFLLDAKAPRWEKFLQEVFGGDEELIDYIQRAVGYSLTGETKEQNLFLCYGTGANGKSVFLRILGELLGDYSGAASFETFNAETRNEAGYDLAVLKGKRLVTVIESNEDRFLDEAKVKTVTGQDEITCRFLHQNFFTYRPEFKIWMAMNHKPVIRGTDHGIWRRIHLIPFTQSFEGRADKSLVGKLGSELSGILNWALVGLQKWQANDGLGMPKAIAEATKEYKRESDSIGQWIEERTTKNPIGQLRAGEGYKDYQAWALDRGERAFGLKAWSRSLAERGHVTSRTNKGVHYFGLELGGAA